MSKEDILKASRIEEELKTWQDVNIKVETEMESENKEPKKEEETEVVAPEPETIESRMILDVDKFEPIESDEDDALCDRLEIKTEIETAEDKSMEAHTYKQEPISEDSKSQDNADTQSSMDDIRQPLPSDGDFDLDDSKSANEQLNKSDVSLLSNVLPKNEIEDIQQKLHSFHSENLMILQTRNKKRASRATTPTSDDIPNTSVASKDSFLISSSSSSISDVGLKNRRISEDENCEFKLEPTMSSIQTNEDESSAYSQYQTDAILQPNPVALGQLIAPGHSYSYAMNRIEPNQTVSTSQMTQIYQTAPPPPPPPSSFPNSALGGYHYLENSNRTPAGYNTSYNTPHMFTMNTSVPPPTLLNSSNYLTKSYTTLSEPSTPVSNVPASPIGVTPSSSTSSTTTTPINPKVLSRTQSADPRLNPQKDVPPVTPKRKLSINEYRKRKQLTTSTEKPKVENIEKVETPAESTKDLITDDKPKNGMATVADTAKETGKIILLYIYIVVV